MFNFFKKQQPATLEGALSHFHTAINELRNFSATKAAEADGHTQTIDILKTQIEETHLSRERALDEQEKAERIAKKIGDIVEA